MVSNEKESSTPAPLTVQQPTLLYVAKAIYRCEEFKIVGIFTTQEVAQKACDEHLGPAGVRADAYEIEKFELNSVVRPQDDFLLTEKNLEEFEQLLEAGPDDAWREREAIERLVGEVRRLWRQPQAGSTPG